jgi:hypothetical protein
MFRRNPLSCLHLPTICCAPKTTACPARGQPTHADRVTICDCPTSRHSQVQPRLRSRAQTDADPVTEFRGDVREPFRRSLVGHSDLKLHTHWLRQIAAAINDPAQRVPVSVVWKVACHTLKPHLSTAPPTTDDVRQSALGASTGSPSASYCPHPSYPANRWKGQCRHEPSSTQSVCCCDGKRRRFPLTQGSDTRTPHSIVHCRQLVGPLSVPAVP